MARSGPRVPLGAVHSTRRSRRRCSRSSVSPSGPRPTAPGSTASTRRGATRAVRQPREAHPPRERLGRADPERSAPTASSTAWLRDGTGGTCWPSSGGLHALLASSASTPAADRRAMRDDLSGPIHTHGTVIVRIDGVDHWVDSSMLTERVIPLVPGDARPATTTRSTGARRAGRRAVARVVDPAVPRRDARLPAARRRRHRRALPRPLRGVARPEPVQHRRVRDAQTSPTHA